MQSLSKSTFLRLLLVDIGLAIVLLVVASLLAKNLIVNNLTQSYGIWILLTLWAPSIIIIPHELYYKSCLTGTNTAAILIFGVFFFPIIPIIIAIRISNTRINQKYAHRFLLVQDYRQIITSCMNIIIVILTVFRGIIKFEEEKCLTEELGGPRCVSPLMVIFAVLSAFILIFSCSSLSMKQKPLNSGRRDVSSEILYLIFLILDVVTSVLSIAFIINYIEYLTIIPTMFIIVVSVIIYSVQSDIQTVESEVMLNGLKKNNAPAALIWNGHDWISKHEESSHNAEFENFHTVSDENISVIIKGMWSLLVHQPIRRKRNIINCNIFLCYVKNLIFTLSIIIVYLLVSLSKDFTYHENILRFETFSVIFKIILCMSSLCPLLLLFKKKELNKTNIVVLVTILALTMFLFALSSNINETGTKQTEMFFVSIQSKNKYHEVNVHNIVNLKDHEFSSQYDIKEIYWDLKCNVTVLPHHSLFFVDTTKKLCKTLIKGINKSVPIISVKKENLLRSSSPMSNNILLQPFQVLYKEVHSANKMLVFDVKPIPMELKQYLSCSNSNNISIMNNVHALYHSNSTYNIKYLFHGRVTELHTIKMHNAFLNIQVECKAVNNPVNFFINNKILSPHKFQGHKGKMFNSCCINATHFLEAFGDCNNTKFFSENLQIYPFGRCSELNLQKFIAFEYKVQCLKIIKFAKPCDTFDNYIKSCNNIECNENILTL